MNQPHNKHLWRSYFHKIDSEEKAYWLGFILGDGCLYRNGYTVGINLKDSDDKHLLKFAKAIRWKGNLYYYKPQKTVLLGISSKEMHADLMNLGLTPAKSLTAKWPKVPKKYECHVLRGLFDADGCIQSYSKGRYACFSLVGTKNILINAKRILKLSNKISPSHTTWQICRRGTPAVYKIYKILYKDATVWLDRKHERFLNFFGNYEPHK